MGCALDPCSTAKGLGVSSCECGEEPSGSVKAEEFLD